MISVIKDISLQNAQEISMFNDEVCKGNRRTKYCGLKHEVWKIKFI